MVYQCLKSGDGRRRGLVEDWETWLSKADELYSRFLGRVGESPFLYHEVAAVGFLASAAALAGFVPLAEYEVLKRAQGRKHAEVKGRADLWFSAGRRCYSFEFKRAWLAATEANLGALLGEALRDVECIDRDEYHYAAGGLIARVRDESRIPSYLQFAESDAVDLAYRIGPPGFDGAFLYFSLCKQDWGSAN
jgi:hypothetical protein